MAKRLKVVGLGHLVPIILLAAFVCIFLFAGQVESAPPAQTSITLTPFCGDAGTVVQVEGTNWPTTPWNQDLVIYWESTGGPILATIESLNTATWTQQVTIPLDAGNGLHTIVAVRQNRSASQTFAIPCSSGVDLWLDKVSDSPTASPGEVLVYTLSYGNKGGQTATGVGILDSIPAESTFYSSASTPGWQQVGATDDYRFQVGDLGAGASGTVKLAVVLDASIPAGTKTVVNVAEVSDDGTHGADINPSDNSASDSTPIAVGLDLSLTKGDGGVTVSPGDILSYDLGYANVGEQGATGVLVTDTVPEYTRYNAAASSNGWTCAPDNTSGSECSYYIGTLPVSASGSIVFAVSVLDPLPVNISKISNTAQISDDGSNGSDHNPSNNTASEDTPVAFKNTYETYFLLHPNVADVTINAFDSETLSYFWAYLNILESSGYLNVDEPAELKACTEPESCLKIALTTSEVKRIHAAKAAHAIWLDKNNTLPWHIYNYSKGNLSQLFDLSILLDYDQGYYFYSVVDYSPSAVYDYVTDHGLIAGSMAESILRVLDNLRSTDSYTGFVPGSEDLGDPVYTAYALQDALRTRAARCSCRISRQGCHSMSRIILGVLRAMNIPGEEVRNVNEEWWYNGHSSADWDILDQVMPHGDDVYDPILALTPDDAFLVSYDFYTDSENTAVCGQDNVCLSARNRALLALQYPSIWTRSRCCNPQTYGYASCQDYLLETYGDVLTDDEIETAAVNISLGTCQSLPGDVQASDGTYTDRVEVTWVPTEAADFYKVYRATLEWGTKGQIASGITQLSYSDETAVPGDIYFYWVASCSDLGCSDLSGFDSGYRKISSPANLQASDGTYTEWVAVTWAASEGADFYRVYRAAEGQVADELTSGTSNISFYDGTATPGVSYDYWVVACSNLGCSEMSGADDGWRKVPTPTNVQAGDGTNSGWVEVSWDKSEGAAYYKIYRAAVEGESRDELTAFTAQLNFNDETAAPGVTYDYWVVACASLGCSDLSDPDTGWRQISNPLNLQVSDGTFTDRVEITWDALEGAEYYKILRAASENGDRWELISNITLLNFQDGTAAPGVLYYYWVVTCNRLVCSEINQYDTGWRKISPPENVQASKGKYSDQVEITWSESFGAGHYRVFRADIAGGSTQELSDPADSPAFEDRTAKTGERYNYYVVACSDLGCSDLSDPATGWSKIGVRERLMRLGIVVLVALLLLIAVLSVVLLRWDQIQDYFQARRLKAGSGEPEE